MILIYTHSWGDESESGTSHIVIEYESKEKFVFDVLEKFKEKNWKEYGSGWYKNHELVQLFKNNDCVHVNKFDVEGIEHNVHTLEEWVNLNKIDSTL